MRNSRPARQAPGLHPASGPRSATSLLLALTLTGCINQPQLYAPPVQREPVLDGQAPKAPKDMLRMSDRDTDAYIIQDIPKSGTDPWRWTGKRPTVRLAVAETSGLKLVVDYSVVENTLKDTGPVNLTFFVNGQPLATVHEDKKSIKHFEKSVPPEMLKPGVDNALAVEIDKVWIAKQDGAQLGFLIGGIGLTH